MVMLRLFEIREFKNFQNMLNTLNHKVVIKLDWHK
jgi:hypothetical protein